MLGYFSKNKTKQNKTTTCSIWDQMLEATEPCTCQCFLCRPGYQELLALPLWVLLSFTSIHELLGFYTQCLNILSTLFMYIFICLCPSHTKLTHILFLLFSFLGSWLWIPSITENLLGVRPCSRRDAASSANPSLPVAPPSGGMRKCQGCGSTTSSRPVFPGSSAHLGLGALAVFETKET